MTIAHQKDLFTKRWRTMRVLEPSELQLQISLVEWCRWKLRPDVYFWHTPNGEQRDKRTAAKLKAMGVLPGVADLIFIWGRENDWCEIKNRKIVPAILFLELKAPGRKQTVEQSAFGLAMLAIGAAYHVVDNIDDAMRIIESYGLTRRSDDYKPRDDFARSIDECYHVIRERMSKGGPGWKPKESE